MRKILALSLLLAACAAPAWADIIEISGFGGYTTVGMKDVNAAVNGLVQELPGQSPSSSSDLSNGYVAGVDIRTGLLIPIPFLSLGVRAEYVGTNTGEWKGNSTLGAYDLKENGYLADAMLGLSFAVDIPATGLGLGAGVYGGYGEGGIDQNLTLNSVKLPDVYYGGNFVGEAEVRVKYKIVAMLNVYAFGGMRFANMGLFEDSAATKQKLPNLIGVPAVASPSVDFSGIDGGLGINLDF